MDETMALEIRNKCERCEKALAPVDEAYICSYECTFCPECTREMKTVCPNCGGGFCPRPNDTG